MIRILLFVILSLAAGAAAADPLEGLWQTQEDDGAYAHVEITPCGEAFCGVITKVYQDGAESASPNIGRQIVIDMLPEGDGLYAGKVWRPSNDKIYIGGIELSGDSMKLAGCIAGGLICKKQVWSRVR